MGEGSEVGEAGRAEAGRMGGVGGGSRHTGAFREPRKLPPPPPLLLYTQRKTCQSARTASGQGGGYPAVRQSEGRRYGWCAPTSSQLHGSEPHGLTVACVGGSRRHGIGTWTATRSAAGCAWCASRARRVEQAGQASQASRETGHCTRRGHHAGCAGGWASLDVCISPRWLLLPSMRGRKAWRGEGGGGGSE